MDAIHFRQRAADAREMSQSGDDIRLSRMLLEVAFDLDAEADAIESGNVRSRRRFRPVGGSEACKATLYPVGSDAEARPVQIVDLSAGGARFRVDRDQVPGSAVILELTDYPLRLCGTIRRMQGPEAAMEFDSTSIDDPALGRLLCSEPQNHRVRA